MGIELKIPGDVDGIRTLADWLSPDLKNAVIDMDLDAANTASNIGMMWTGEAAYAFESAIHDVRKEFNPVSGYLGDTGPVFRAYANRLERGREDFAEWAADATDAGLTVTGEVIAPPTTTLMYCPGPGADPEDLEEYEGYLKKVELYNEIAEDVGTWWGKLEEWVIENIVPLISRIEEFSNIRNPLNYLSVNNETVATTILSYYDETLAQNLEAFKGTAAELQSDYETFKRQLRSGNPAVRAAAEAANPPEMRQALRTLNDDIADLAKHSKILGKALPGIDILIASADIAGGASPSSVGVEFVGGATAAALFTAAIATVEIPPVAAVIAIAGVGVLAGGAAVWLYESAVPIDVRETIDEGLRDFGDWLIFWD